MREIETIYETLLETFAQRAGFRPEEGCDLSVRLWAAAAQLQALEMQGDWVLDQSFPQTAQGIYLDRHGQMRGLTRRPAAKAVGTLRFSVRTPASADLTIPADTVCMTEGEVRFRTIQPAVLKAGMLTAEAPAEALEGGAAGNAAPGAVCILTACPLAVTGCTNPAAFSGGVDAEGDGEFRKRILESYQRLAPGAVCILTACPLAVTGCTNPAAFSGGVDAEGDGEFRKRILESYQRLPNGANAAWYEQTAISFGGVAAARAVGRARGIGTVDVYVTAESGIPSESLLTDLEAELQKKREIAVDVAVKAPTVWPVDVTVAVAAREGWVFSEVKSAVEQSLTSFFTGRLLGRPVRLAELGNRLYGLEGVENYRFSLPTADLTADDTMLPVLGKLTVTELEAAHV